MDGRKDDARHAARFHATAPSTGSNVSGLSSASVCILDDNRAIREALGDLFRSMNYAALYGSVAEFPKVALPDVPACLILDVPSPGTSGLELREYPKSTDVRLPVILMTGFGKNPMSVRGMKRGAVDFLTKPINDLLDAVAAAMQIQEAQRQHLAHIAKLKKKI